MVKAASSRSPRMSREVRSRQLIQAARAVLNEKGYENLVLADVAQRAGIVEGAIYRYFTGKRELVITAAESWFEDILSGVRPDPSIVGTRERLHYVITRALQLIMQEPALARFVLSDIRFDPAYRTTALYNLNRRYAAAVMDVLRDAIGAGEFYDDVSLFLLRDMIFGCIERQAWGFLQGTGKFVLDEVADGISRVIYRGMIARDDAGDDLKLNAVMARMEAVADRLERCTTAPVAPPDK